MDQNLFYYLLVLTPPLLLALTFHELAHARTALAFGDHTAASLGRVTLNPLAHVDPLGLVMMYLGLFGWGKPVPINPMNLHPRRLGNFAVALAGPMANVALLVLSLLAYKLVLNYGHHLAVPAAGDDGAGSLSSTAGDMAWISIQLNVALFVFNLIPLYPLDGHHILRELLPERMHEGYMRWQVRVGVWGLVALVLMPRVLSMVTHDKIVFHPLQQPCQWIIHHAIDLLHIYS